MWLAHLSEPVALPPFAWRRMDGSGLSRTVHPIAGPVTVTFQLHVRLRRPDFWQDTRSVSRRYQRMHKVQVHRRATIVSAFCKDELV